MAENGNGVENGNGKDKGTFNILITQDEMAVAFKLAEELGIKEEFGNSSPLGGIVILLTNLAICVFTLQARIDFIVEKALDDLKAIKEERDDIR